MKKLTAKEKKALAYLQKNPHTTHASLAEHLGVATQTGGYYFRQLQLKGYLTPNPKGFTVK